MTLPSDAPPPPDLPMDVASCVARGVEWLDARAHTAQQENVLLPSHPLRSGWWLAIDLANLRMYWATDCILGQVYGDFWKAPGIDTVSGEDAVLGFNVKFSEDDSGRTAYDKLTAEWKRVIQRLREERITPLPTADDAYQADAEGHR